MNLSESDFMIWYNNDLKRIFIQCSFFTVLFEKMKSAGNSKRGAKRSLFGTRCSKRIDPHFRQLEKGKLNCNDCNKDRLFSAEIKKASERWGFDFAADRPLEATNPENLFSWEPVPAKKVPSFYRSKPTKSRRTTVTNSSPLKNKTTNSKVKKSIPAKFAKFSA